MTHKFQKKHSSYSLTLVDSLDTLFIVGEKEEFVRAIRLVVSNVDFDKDVVVNVFETTIRGLGGLLSAHMLAEKFLGSEEYNSELLNLAVDLGNRLLVAFDTPTGIPYSLVNLRKGVVPELTSVTCLAGAGTLILEFGMLSRLRKDDRYEIAAKKAITALWKRKSQINLLGNSIDVISGEWVSKVSSIGAGTDSFFEYLLKANLLLGNESYLSMFHDAYTAIESRVKVNGWYFSVAMDNANLLYTVAEGLSAFWPALQVFAEEYEAAFNNFSRWFGLWLKFRCVPGKANLFMFVSYQKLPFLMV